ncbi:MAG: NAD(P)/FAD-dependent oxidoreductase [Candidatus Ornithospirochaeta sp.]
MRKTDVLVIGGGPGGMSAAQYAARAGYSTLILDPMGPGGQLLYIDEIENYPGLGKTSGYVLSSEMEKQCAAFGVEIEYAAATLVKKEGNAFIVSSDIGEVEAKAVIAATGASHRHIGAKGEEEYGGRGVSYCATCDGPFFRGKDVVVAGGGDTALTDAIYLSKMANSVTIVHRRDTFRAQKALQEKLKGVGNISTVMGRNIIQIKGNGTTVTSVLLDDGNEIKCDGVFVFVGTVPNSAIFSPICGTENGFVMTNEKMETTLPGLFAVGDLRNTSFRQVVTAAGDGAKAAHSADEYISENNL